MVDHEKEKCEKDDVNDHDYRGLANIVTGGEADTRHLFAGLLNEFAYAFLFFALIQSVYSFSHFIPLFCSLGGRLTFTACLTSGG